MTNKLKALLEGSPSKFFDQVRSDIEERIAEKMEEVAETVAPTVFEHVEQLDELSKATLGRYTNRAAGSLDHNAGMEGYKDSQLMSNSSAMTNNMSKAQRDTVSQHKDIYARKAKNRIKGIRTATSKLVKESEQLEISEDLETKGYKAANSGKKWWKNPHPSGSKEAYAWDQGHTKWRQEQLNKKNVNEEQLDEKQNVKMLGRYRIVHKTSGAVLDSHDDKNEAINLGKKHGVGNVRLVDTNKNMNEDMGAHTISTTRGGKNGKTFSTFVVNKKRTSKSDSQRRWTDLVRKHTPKETVWDKD